MTVRGSMLKGVAVALVAAAVLAPAAAAKPYHPTLNLALVPLSKAALGSEARGLPIAPGSGAQYDGVGHVSGYALDYGSLFLARPGLDEVSTGVDAYKTMRAAERALRDDRKSDVGLLANFTQLNLTATGASFSVPAIGDSHWTRAETFSVANYGSFSFAIEAFRDGKYVLHVAVAAGSQDLATFYAAVKARALDRRLQLGLAGRLHGRRVRLPSFRQPGPPASGLDPGTMVLQTSDLAGSQIQGEEYDYFPGALSSYDLSFQPAGSFDSVEQTVSVMPSTTSAAFAAAFLGVEEIAFSVNFAGTADTVVTPVDVSAAGDEAQAAVVSISTSRLHENVAVVTLHSGAVADIVFAENPTTIDPTDVQALAQAAAARLDAALS